MRKESAKNATTKRRKLRVSSKRWFCTASMAISDLLGRRLETIARLHLIDRRFVYELEDSSSLANDKDDRWFSRSLQKNDINSREA